MAIDQREWSIKYDGTKKQIQNKRTTGYGNISDEELKSIQSSVGILETQLNTMSSAPMNYEISASEIARRKCLMTYLQKQLVVISNTASARKNPSKMGHLSIDSSSVNTKSSGYNGQSATMNPMTTGDGLLQRQKDIVKLQDEMISDIESGVDRLCDKARNIGDEAKLHDHLLDDLDHHVDVTTSALQAEAAHAEQIKEKGKVCSMYICIAIEIIILFIMIIIIMMH